MIEVDRIAAKMSKIKKSSILSLILSLFILGIASFIFLPGISSAEEQEKQLGISYSLSHLGYSTHPDTRDAMAEEALANAIFNSTQTGGQWGGFVRVEFGGAKHPVNCCVNRASGGFIKYPKGWRVINAWLSQDSNSYKEGTGDPSYEIYLSNSTAFAGWDDYGSLLASTGGPLPVGTIISLDPAVVEGGAIVVGNEKILGLRAKLLNDDTYKGYGKRYVAGLPTLHVIVSSVVAPPTPEEEPAQNAGADKCIAPYVKGNSLVNLSIGNLFFDKAITTSTGTGLTTNLTLSYNGRESSTGPFGSHFTHNYNICLKDSIDWISFIDEDGTKIISVPTEEEPSIYEPLPRTGEKFTIIKNPDGTYFLTKKYGTKYSFNSEGRITQIEDRNGNIQAFDYDASGNLAIITDSSGRITTLSYTDNKVTSVTDPAGKTTTFEYDGDNLIKITDPLGYSQQYTYDENNRIISKTDPKENIVTYSYDEKNRLISSKLNDEPPITISYDDVNSKATVTDSKGNVTTYSYNLEFDTLPELKDAQSNLATNTFDENRNLLSTTDQAGNTTSYTYDENGNLLTLTDPEANTTTYTYESIYNQITSITDPKGDKTSYTYDGKGNLASITDPDNKTTGYAYDEKGNLISITNPENQATSFEYDDVGNLSKITDNLGNITSFTYDASGNMLSRTDPEGNTALFEYNALNQLIKITDPKGNTTTFTYDANGNRISSTDALNNTTSYEYNAKNQLIKVTDSKGGVTQYRYDNNGNRTAVVDANGNTTTYAYDSLNRLISETGPAGDTISYAYDAKGNLISRTDANGVTTNYTYNPLNHLTQTLYPKDLAVNYSYDSLGNLIHFDDNINNLAVNYTYDKLSRLTKLDIASKGAIRYEYDSLGNRIKMIDPEGKTTTYSYDELNRLVSLTNPDNLTTTYAYDKLGRRIRMNYPNNTYTTYSYDKLSRLINLTNYGKGKHDKIISSYDYTYDALGNRLTKKEKSVGVRFIEPATTTYYSYDSLYQLIKARSSHGWDINYDYDSVGNRTKLTTSFIHPFLKDYCDHKIELPEKIHPLATVSYSYNSANQLIKEEQLIGRKEIPIKTIDYGYDGNGNQVLKDLKLGNTLSSPLAGEEEEVRGKEFLTSYGYDPENRLTGIAYTSPYIFREATRTNNFAYCPFGKRIYKSDSSGDTFYFYDGDNILLELDDKNRTLARYTTGLGIDEWISKTTSTSTFPLPQGERTDVVAELARPSPQKKAKTIYYHYDGLGSVVALTDEQGNVVESYNYSPFGTLVPEGIASPYLAPAKERIHNYFPPSRRNTITYTGREYESDSSLYFYRARYYDSKVGRFLSKDPLSLGGSSSGGGCATCGTSISVGAPMWSHPYVYVENNPVNYTDPTGESGLTVISIVIGGRIISKVIYTCYTTSQCTRCMNTALKYSHLASQKLKPYLRFYEWFRASQPGKECAQICGAAVESLVGSVWDVISKAISPMTP